MEPIYRQSFTIASDQVDCFSRLKSTVLLGFIQDVSGHHSDLLGYTWEGLAQRRLFWAVVRHRVQIERLPMEGETITLETWPCPTTRVAYPRSVIAYDEAGREIFRAMTLWVLMNMDTRAMILPGSSGVEVTGLTRRGMELDAPASLFPAKLSCQARRSVCYTDLDKNGHMNNVRYQDWAEDLLPSAFHRDHPLKELVICYLSEAREGQALDMAYELSDGPELRVDVSRQGKKPGDKAERVCAIRAIYGAC